MASKWGTFDMATTTANSTDFKHPRGHATSHEQNSQMQSSLLLLVRESHCFQSVKLVGLQRGSNVPCIVVVGGQCESSGARLNGCG